VLGGAGFISILGLKGPPLLKKGARLCLTPTKIVKWVMGCFIIRITPGINPFKPTMPHILLKNAA
jgi:hypothetical protein